MRTQADGYGCDIVSFEEPGCERLIEVKTTSFGGDEAILYKQTQVPVSVHREEHYEILSVLQVWSVTSGFRRRRAA